MSDTKKDLTRIEDLGELLHSEGNAGLDSFGESDTAVDLLPDLPPDLENESPPAFESSPVEEESLASDDPFASDSPPEFAQEEENDFQLTDEPVSATEDQPESDPFATSETEDSTFESNEQNESNVFSLSESSETNESDQQLSEDFSLEDNNEVEEKVEEPEEELNQFSEPESSVQNYTEEPQDDPQEEIQQVQTKQQPESFSDIKKFAENISYGDVSSPGNPPFSLILAGDDLFENQDKIIEILLNVQVIKAGQENEFKERIERGSILIPRISEYAAIYLANMLKHHVSSITMGLSDIVREPKSYKPHEEIGSISKNQLNQNQHEKIQWSELEKNNEKLEQMPVTTLNALPGYEVISWHGVLQHNLQIILDDSKTSQNLEQTIIQFEEYASILKRLKFEADQLGANALIGVQSQLIPIDTKEKKFQLLVTGNAVKIKKGTPWEAPIKNTTPV